MNTIYYTIASGDTLWSIAQKYNTTVDVLTRYNGLIYPDKIYTGQEIRIPLKESDSPAWYVVQKGDTLYTISEKYGLPVNEILQLNTIANPNIIYPGRVLRLKTQ